MATTTPNIGLTLPVGTEQVSRQIINGNMTLIDTAVGNIKLTRKIKTYTNITLPSGNNPYVQIDSYTGLGVDSNKYLVSMNIRGWTTMTCGNVVLTKGSDGTKIYVMASSGGTIASLTVEYFFVSSVTNV